MKLDEARQLLKKHGYDIEKNGRRQINEWLGMYKMSYIVTFGNWDQEYSSDTEQVEILAWSISEAAQEAEKMLKNKKGTILAIELGTKQARSKYSK